MELLEDLSLEISHLSIGLISTHTYEFYEDSIGRHRKKKVLRDKPLFGLDCIIIVNCRLKIGTFYSDGCNLFVCIEYDGFNNRSRLRNAHILVEKFSLPTTLAFVGRPFVEESSKPLNI